MTVALTPLLLVSASLKRPVAVGPTGSTVSATAGVPATGGGRRDDRVWVWAVAAGGDQTMLFAAFAASFFHPRTKRDWRAMGAFTAFLVALFTEMYGALLTVYLLGSWLGSRFPALRATHADGHLWNDLIGWKYDPHLSPLHLASYVLIGGGFWLIAAAWRVLHQAAQAGTLATGGPYAHVRHPQYAGLLLIMTGFPVQWPAIPTLITFPVLVLVYLRLARSEEREVARRQGQAWAPTPPVLRDSSPPPSAIPSA